MYLYMACRKMEQPARNVDKSVFYAVLVCAAFFALQSLVNDPIIL